MGSANQKPVNIGALERLASIAENTGRYDVAVKALETLCRSFPNMPRLRHRQALVYLKMQNIPKATRSFLIAADFYIESESRSMAIALLNSAVKQIPDSPELARRLEALYKGQSFKVLSPEQKQYHYDQISKDYDYYTNPDEVIGELQHAGTVEFKDLSQELTSKPRPERDHREKSEDELRFETLSPRSKFLRALPKDAWKLIWEHGKVQKIKAKQTLHPKEDEICFVLEGEIETEVTEVFKTKSVHLFREGELLLPLNAKKEKKCEYLAKTKSNAQVLFFNRDYLDQALQKNQTLNDYLTEQENEHSAILLMRRSSLFGDLPLSKLHQLKSLFISKSFREGDKVIEEAALREPLFYFIVQGKLSVYRKFGSPQQQLLSELFPSDFFGERSFLTSTPSMATCQADTDLSCLAISRSQLDHVLSIYPQFTDRLNAVVENRVRIAVEKEIEYPSSSLQTQISFEEAGKADKSLPDRDIYDCEIFFGLDPKKVDEILRKCALEKFVDHQMLLRKGAKAGHLMIVKSGHLRIYDFDEAGNEINRTLVGPGYLVGEDAIFGQRISSYFCESSGETEVYFLSFDQIDSISQLIPGLKQNLRRLYQVRIADRILEQSAFFKDLHSEHRELIKCQKIIEFETGDVLIKQGQGSKAALRILISGELQVSKAKAGRSILLAKLTPGQIFGESSIVSGMSSSASIEAVSSGLAFEIEEKNLSELLKKVPTFGAYIIKIFRERVYFNIETMISSWRNSILASEEDSESHEDQLIKNVLKSKS